VVTQRDCRPDSLVPLADVMDTGERANHGNVQAVWGRDAHRRAVTRWLGILPSGVFEAGERISRRSEATRGSSAWLLTSSLN
jgi:hypothetical protein